MSGYIPNNFSDVPKSFQYSPNTLTARRERRTSAQGTPIFVPRDDRSISNDPQIEPIYTDSGIQTMDFPRVDDLLFCPSAIAKPVHPSPKKSVAVYVFLVLVTCLAAWMSLQVVWAKEQFDGELKGMRLDVANLVQRLGRAEKRAERLQRLLHELNSTGKTTQLINEALRVYDADKTGLKDFALGSAGAAIIDTPGTTGITIYRWTLLGLLNWDMASRPDTILEPDTRLGQCYSFQGTRGSIRIRLSAAIRVSSVTLEHASADLTTAEELLSAPRKFRVYGLQTSSGEKDHLFGHFKYDAQKGPRQTFVVAPAETSHGAVELHILSNHGNEEFTCVYRFRVHGTKVL